MPKKQIKKFCVVIAAYNESKTISKVIREVKKYCKTVIVVDDGSADDTGELALKAGAIVMRHSINLGQGAALETGFEFVRRNFSEYAVVTYDADAQFLAKEIPLVVNPVLSGKTDVVLGSRFLGKVYNMPSSRKVILKLALVFTWVVSGISLSDAANGFRALSPLALSKIKLTQNRMAHASELIDLIIRYDLKYLEVPVSVIYHEDRMGQANTGAFKVVKDLFIEKFLP